MTWKRVIVRTSSLNRPRTPTALSPKRGIMFKDTGIQADPTGRTHVQSDGSSIGGVDPASYSAKSVIGKKNALLLSTSGTTQLGKYPAFMWYCAPRAVPPNTGRLTMKYKFKVRGGLVGINVFETDTILILKCADGVVRKFNLSLQRHAANGQIDIGNWTDSGIRMTPLALNFTYKISVAYSFDVVKNVCSVLSYADNVSGAKAVPAALQNMPATPSNWAVGAIPQVQLGSLPSAQPWQVKIWDHQYIWS